MTAIGAGIDRVGTIGDGEFWYDKRQDGYSACIRSNAIKIFYDGVPRHPVEVYRRPGRIVVGGRDGCLSIGYQPGGGNRNGGRAE